MAYDDDLADRIRTVIHAVLQGDDQVTEKPMFGGHAFLVDGHLALSASSRGGLLLRVDPADLAAFLQEPHVGPFEMRGSAMKGWLHVEPAAVEADESLRRWVEVGVARAQALPAT